MSVLVKKKPARSMPSDGGHDTVASPALTAETLEQRDLQTKINMYKSGKVGGDHFLASLAPNDQQACWKRFEFHRAKSQEASSAWGELKQVGRGHNKDQKKKGCCSWLF